MIQIPNLTIDRDGDDPDAQVMLTQDFGGNEHMVSLHPCQVRLLFERMGLVAPSSNIESDRTIMRLCRQMRILCDRIDRLDDMVREAAGRGHEDLEAETVFSFATWELANEFVTDLPGNAGVTPAALPAADVRRMSPSEADNSRTESGQALPLFFEEAVA